MPIQIEVILDNREKEELREIFESKKESLPFKLETLALGDIEFRNQANNEPLLRLERKTLADLAASIGDSRWRNQKVRLLASKDCPCAYLIEGLFSDAHEVYPGGVTKHTVVAALCNTLVRDGMAFICSESKEQTWNWIKTLAVKIGEHGGCAGLGQQLGKAAGVNSYLDTVQTVKAKNINPGNALSFMLIQLPSISSPIAEAVGRQYASLQRLVEAYLGCATQKAAEHLLEDLVVKEGAEGVKARRIGPAASKKIWAHISGNFS